MIIKKLSIIIPTYNDAIALRITLTSLSAVRFRNQLDVVIIDGGSSDDTKNVIDEFKNIVHTFESSPDNGEYDAMNRGIELAKAEYVIFLMAGDCVFQRENGGDLEDIIGPSFLQVYRKKGNCKVTELKPKSSLFFGLPHCHQGIIYKRPIPYFDLKYKISSDYAHYLDCDYSASLPLYESSFFVVYDEGRSGENYLIRDFEIANISREKFGRLIGLTVLLLFRIKHLIKYVSRNLS